MALEYAEKSPRELAWFMTNTQNYLISEASVYRILKVYDLVTSPAFIVLIRPIQYCALPLREVI